jgi:CoA:oxalate CoA-transferase
MSSIERGPGPLDGIRVLDFTRVLAGPHCARMLVDFGAEVIKFEPLDGDLTRVSNPKVASIATYFTQQNCGKSNISMDLRSPEAVELVLRLVDEVDVVVENFRPDVMGRLGLGWDVLHARNPRLIYATISGYGTTGPWAKRRAYAPAISAEMGITAMQEDAFGTLSADSLSIADLFPSMEALAGILAALYHRERTGLGQHVEVSMAETMLSVNEHAHWHLQRDLDGMSESGFVPSFSTEDHPIVTVAGQRVLLAGHPAIPATFLDYCDAMGRPDLIDDPRLATVDLRKENLPVMYEALQAWADTFDSVEPLMKIIDDHELATGVVRTLAEAVMTPWAVERGVLVEVDDRAGGTLRMPNSPVRFSNSDAGMRGGTRYRGEDNRTVLSTLLGLDEVTLDDLEARKVLSSRVPGAR